MGTSESLITSAMTLVADLALALGVKSICNLPGCWVHQVDDQWKIAVNGHREPIQYERVNVPPFSVWVEFNGWPAGLFDAHGGTLAAGEAANEETFCAAIKKAIGEVGKVKA